MPDANLDSLTRADVDGLNLFRASAGIEPLMLIDAVANRPAAGTVNRFFYATDEQRLYRDTGSAWEDLQIPESALIDGGIVARLAAAETVSGDWTFSGDQDFTGAVQFSGQNVYTPESQGAVDGTDDDVQIQAAIDAAEAAGGGIVLLRPVTYVVGSTLTVGDNITLLGAGMFSTILQAKAALNDPIIRNDDLTNGNTGITLLRMTLDGNNANQTDNSGDPEDQAKCAFFEKVTRVVVKDVWFKDPVDTCISFRGTAGTHSDCKENALYNVWASGCGDAAINFDFCEHCTVDGLRVFETGFDDAISPRTAPGLWAYFSDFMTFENMTFERIGGQDPNNITNAGGHAIQLQSVRRCTINNFVIDTPLWDGVFIRSNSDPGESDPNANFVSITNGVIEKPGRDGIRLVSDDHTASPSQETFHVVVGDVAINRPGDTTLNSAGAGSGVVLLRSRLVSLDNVHVTTAADHGLVVNGAVLTKVGDCHFLSGTDGIRVLDATGPARSWDTLYVSDTRTAANTNGINVTAGSGTMRIVGGDIQDLTPGSATVVKRAVANLEHDFYSAVFAGYGNPSAGNNSHGSPATDDKANLNLTDVPVPFACKARNMQVEMITAPGSGETLDAILMKNGSEQALKATVSGAGTTGSDTSNEVSLAAGDLITIRFTASNNGGYSGAHAKAAFELIAEPD